MDDRFSFGSLYVLHHPPPGSPPFVKVVETSPTHVYVRFFALPPKLGWVPAGVPTPIVQAAVGDPLAAGGIEVRGVDLDEFASWRPQPAAHGGVAQDEREAVHQFVLRQFSSLPDELVSQLRQVEASRDGELHYRPCRVRLRDGTTLDHVYVVEAEPYLRRWGRPPDGRAVEISDVVALGESPGRLPARLADKMYAAGESGMGYCLFTLVLHDGRRLPVSTGNAVDFPNVPRGVTPEMIADLLPHEGRDLVWEDEWEGSYQDPPVVRWCLYRP